MQLNSIRHGKASRLENKVKIYSCNRSLHEVKAIKRALPESGGKMGRR